MYQLPYATVVENTTSPTWELGIHPSATSKFKRCLDILGSLVGLLILAILFVPIAIAIKIESPGPIFLYKAVILPLDADSIMFYKVLVVSIILGAYLLERFHLYP